MYMARNEASSDINHLVDSYETSVDFSYFIDAHSGELKLSSSRVEASLKI